MEIVIVLALVSLIAAIGPTFSSSSISRSYALSERDLLVGLLTQTRANALANVHKSAHSLYVDSNSYVLYEGTNYSSGNTTNRIVPRLSKAQVTGLQTVTFLQLTADVVNPGTITITGDTETYIVEINDAGRINW